MTCDEMNKIQQEVVLGLPQLKQEPEEHRKFRASISADVAEMRKRGVMATYPTDWDIAK